LCQEVIEMDTFRRANHEAVIKIVKKVVTETSSGGSTDPLVALFPSSNPVRVGNPGVQEAGRLVCGWWRRDAGELPIAATRG
jgi:hypothetical protein